MRHFLFTCRRWTDAEHRLLFMSPEKPDANRPPPIEGSEQKKEAPKGGPDASMPPLDARTVRQRDQINRRSLAMRSDVEKGLQRAKEYLQNVSNGVYRLERQNFEKQVRSEAIRNKVTDPQQAKEFYAAKLADFHAWVAQQPIMMRLQTDQYVKAPNSRIPAFHVNPGTGDTPPKVVFDAQPSAPNAGGNAPKAAPGTKPSDNPEQDRYVDGIRKDVNDAVVKMRDSKDIFEAFGHMSVAIGKGMEGLTRAMDGSLLKQTPEGQSKKQARTRTLNEAKAVPGDGPLASKITALQQSKSAQLLTAEAQKLAAEKALPALQQAKSDAETAVKGLPSGSSPERIALEAKLAAATAALAAAEQALANANQQIQTLKSDATTIDEMKRDLATMQTKLEKMFSQAFGPTFLAKLGPFTVTPDGLVPTPMNPPSLLQQAFPQATAEKPVTPVMITAMLAKNQRKAA
jgi:hypothetical protein